jgi:enoyl-CoA hydratase/carnithine racemase
MTYEQILVEQRGRVGIITMNRPERLNAWSPTMDAEMREVVAAWDEDPGVGAIVFTGAGRGYCAGADVGRFNSDIESRRSADESEAPAPRRAARSSGWTEFILGLSTPTISAVNGVAVGMGLTTTLSMDVRIASERAKFGAVFVKMGVTPELGSSYFLSQLVGLGRATEWALTGRLVPAQEALEAGLVAAVVPHDDLLERAVETAAVIASRPTPQVAATRLLMRRHASATDISAVLALETRVFADARSTWEHAEAVQAFLQKRDADFSGRAASPPLLD